MTIDRILLVGGSGFLGASIATCLVRQGMRVTVPTRRAARAKHLKVLPTVEIIEADIHNADRLAELVCGHDAVINLVGVLHGDFAREHVALPGQIAEACAATGTSRLIQMSALNASMDGPSEYLQSKYRGESAVLEVARRHGTLNVTIFRPSVVFGEHDKFLNMFASLIRSSPLVPLGSASARFQPVWVEDVARAVVASLAQHESFGQTYPLVGPEVYTLRELMEFVMQVTGQHRPILELGAGLSVLQAAVFEHLPGKLITRDNVRSMSIPNTSSEPFPAIFGAAHSMESTMPGYLHPGMSREPGRARYDRFRLHAGRNP